MLQQKIDHIDYIEKLILELDDLKSSGKISEKTKIKGDGICVAPTSDLIYAIANYPNWKRDLSQITVNELIAILKFDIEETKKELEEWKNQS